MKIELLVELPYNHDAEDALWNDFQSLEMLQDLVSDPVIKSIWEYLCTNYGYNLQVCVTASLMD